MFALFKASKLTALLAVLSFLVFLIYRIQLLTQVQADLGGIEFNVIYHLQSLFSNSPLYTHPELPPFSINQYGPLYYYLVFVIGKIGGVRGHEVLQIFTLSRGVSLGLSLVYTALVYLFSRRIFQASKSAAGVAAVFSFIFLEPTSFSRPDSLSHLFILGSLFCFFLWIKQAKHQFLWAAAIVSCVGLFAKQNVIAVPLICVLWLLTTKRYKPFWHFALSWSLTFILAVLIIHFAFGIKIYLANTVMGLNNGISLNWVFDYIIKPFFTSYGLLFLLLAILHQYIVDKNAEPVFHFSRWVMAGLFLITCLFALKWGSWVSYFTEWWTFVFIASPYIWNRLKHKAGFVYNAFQWLLPFVFFIKTLVISYPLTHNAKTTTRQAEWEKFQADQRLVRSIQAGLKKGEMVLLNTFQPTSFYANLLHAQLLVPQFEIVYFTTYTRKVFDYSQLKEIVKSGKVKYVIAPVSPGGIRLSDFDLSSFHPIDSTESVKILAWKPESQ